MSTILSVIPSFRDIMIDMAISALSEQTEELETLLAPQEHEPFQSYVDDLQEARHLSYNVLELLNAFPLPTRFYFYKHSGNSVEHHKRLFCSYYVKQY